MQLSVATNSAASEEGEDEAVEVYDVLAAMASSLVETEAHFNVTVVPDRPVTLVVGGKPPREVFYNKSVTFMTQLPKPTMAKRCSCKYVCTGATATIKCYNCATFDPYGVGYFCDMCFKSRHPWHRVAHIYADIENDENIEYTMRIAHRRAEAVRYEKEGMQILEKVKNEKKRYACPTGPFDMLPFVILGICARLKANIKIGNSEETIKVVGRKTTDLIAKMRELKSNLRESIEDLRSTYPLPSEEQILSAASLIKRCLMGFKVVLYHRDSNCRLTQLAWQIRKLISLMYVERLAKVFDKRTSRGVFMPAVFVLIILSNLLQQTSTTTA
jgi:hypothetical protein